MENILELKNITKVYPGVVALDNVSVSFCPGEVHAIMGENGAGKSTLIKVMSGAIRPDAGTICVEGQEFQSMTPALSRKSGLEVVYQEFNLVPGLSVGENIFLGDKLGNAVFQDFKQVYSRAQEILQKFHLDVDPRLTVRKLSNSQKQLVEIAKAISTNAKVLVLDEPTSALATREADILLDLVAMLRKEGTCIIYISHRMDEIFRIADRVTVLRDGQYVATKPIGELNREKLIELMVGRHLNETFPERLKPEDEIALEVKNLSGNGVENISFQLHKREILGFAGLVGAGRTELAKVIYGAAKSEAGYIYCCGNEVKIKKPSQAIKNGIGLIPEDRKGEGVFLNFSVSWNTSIMALRGLSKHTFVNRKKVSEVTDQYIKKLRVKTASQQVPVKTLSGGNQQKVALAKTLATQTKILIFDEPTRGIDVGAKQEIYKLMAELTAEGYSIIMISSEMEELIGMSDRILVMHEGSLNGELKREEFDQKKILQFASGMITENAEIIQ